MRILVVGAGATGGYFGARLAQAGQDVTFLLREKRALAVEQNGLTVHSPHGDFHFQPNVLQASQLTGPYDLILLTVKSFGLEAAMKDIAPVVGENTMVMPVLNGMKHMETLSLRFGEHALIGGLCRICGRSGCCFQASAPSPAPCAETSARWLLHRAEQSSPRLLSRRH